MTDHPSAFVDGDGLTHDDGTCRYCGVQTETTVDPTASAVRCRGCGATPSGPREPVEPFTVEELAYYIERGELPDDDEPVPIRAIDGRPLEELTPPDLAHYIAHGELPRAVAGPVVAGGGDGA